MLLKQDIAGRREGERVSGRQKERLRLIEGELERREGEGDRRGRLKNSEEEEEECKEVTGRR